MSFEKWNYHHGRTVASHLSNGLNFRQKGQEYVDGIVTPVTIDNSNLEFFILTNSKDPKHIEGVDFDYVNLRIPAGFRNVEYTLQDGLIDQFDVQPASQVKCDKGFFGVTLIHFRESGFSVPPFIHKDGIFHHCDARGQSRGRDCPTFISYGFLDDKKTTDFGRLKIFFYEGKSSEGRRILSEDSGFLISDNGFYLVPLIFPDKSLLYGIICDNNYSPTPKEILNKAFFTNIQKAKSNNSYDVIFLETKDSVFRDDSLSIYFKLVYDYRKPDEYRMDVEGCSMSEDGKFRNHLAPKTLLKFNKKMPDIQANADAIYPIVKESNCKSLIGIIDLYYVDSQHRFLKNRVTPNSQNKNTSGHATQSALVIASNDPVLGGTYNGIDKRAEIISAAIGNQAQVSLITSLLDALEHLLRADSIPNVINIAYSLPHPCDNSEEDQLIALINEANSKNVLICWSVNNNATNDDADNNRPCHFRYLPLSLGEKFPNLIRVSSIKQYEREKLLRPFIDLCAKDKIVIPGVGQPTQLFEDNSAATALVSGVASLLYRASCGFFTAEQIKNVLIQNRDEENGIPILHADNAIKELVKAKSMLTS